MFGSKSVASAWAKLEGIEAANMMRKANRPEARVRRVAADETVNPTSEAHFLQDPPENAQERTHQSPWPDVGFRDSGRNLRDGGKQNGSYRPDNACDPPNRSSLERMPTERSYEPQRPPSVMLHMSGLGKRV